jgi:ABC-2 type transport system ATP-binding protein
MTEGHKLPPEMTLRQLARTQRMSFDRWREDSFAELTGFFKFDLGRRFKHLSRGQKAQFNLALVLAQDPELLVMDDPTLGLDPVVCRDFCDLLVGLMQKEGRTIFFTSHSLATVERVADEIAILDHGVLKAHCGLNTFRERLRRVAVRFDGVPPADPGIPGLVKTIADGDRLIMTIANYEDADIAALRERFKVKSVEPLELNLEDAFVDYTAGLDGRPLPRM